MRVVGLLSGEREVRLRACVEGGQDWKYVRVEARPVSVGDWLSGEFWSGLGVRAGEVAAAGLEQGQAAALGERLEAQGTPGPWARCASAVVAVLAEGTAGEWEAAAGLGFDGLLSAAWEGSAVRRRLRQAWRRSQQRLQRETRYRRARTLCRRVNQTRRRLRDQVGLLCGDLVRSNMQFAQTLRQLERAYVFQTELMGEFDQRYLFYKALRALKAELGEASAALYVCERDAFEAHIAGAWYEDSRDLAEMEALFAGTVVRLVRRTGRPVRLARAEECSELPRREREKLAGLSVLAAPVAGEKELLGVVVVYRATEAPLGQAEQDMVVPLLAPLGRAMITAQKVRHLVGSA